MKTAILFLLAAGIAPLLAQAGVEMRPIWTASDGRSIQAKFLATVRFKPADPNREVLVIEKDWRTFSVPITKLAPASAAYARRLEKLSVADARIAKADVAAQEDVAKIIAKMDRIIFPQIELSRVSPEMAVDFLRIKSRDLDTTEADPAQKGVIIITQGDIPADNTISISLTNVPLSEALRYITDLAGMTYNVDRHAVQVGPPGIIKHELDQRIFRVPPDFLALAFGGAPAEPADPFAPSPAENGAAPPPPKTVIDILNKHGIMFFDGIFAVYDKATSQLLVRGDPVMLEQVEASLEEARQKAEPQQQAK